MISEAIEIKGNSKRNFEVLFLRGDNISSISVDY